MSPKHFVHYTTFEVLTIISDSKSLLASDFRALNDAQEFRFGLKLVRDYFELLGAWWSFFQEQHLIKSKWH